MEKKIVIIGAGIAGLSAGCYARMNGYDAEIYESHSLPGGEELGAVQGRRIYNHEEFFRFTDTSGKTFITYSDVERFEKHMKELSPSDSVPIELLCKLIRRFAKFKSPMEKEYELYNLFDIIKMIWTMTPFMKDFNFCS